MWLNGRIADFRGVPTVMVAQKTSLHLWLSLQVSMVYNLPRSASVRAATPCVIFLLDRADLNRVLKHYPDGKGISVKFLESSRPITQCILQRNVALV